MKGLRGFTLIELLVVIAIMGMLGMASIGAYRSMRRGMEERAVLQNASQFIRLAYQRSQIDGVPVKIFFWNELAAEETDESAKKVFGRAVAVRRLGRVSLFENNYLCDEFGNLDAFKCKRLDGTEDLNANPADGPGTYIYRIDAERQMRRSLVTMSTFRRQAGRLIMLSDEAWSGENDESSLNVYGYYVRDRGGISWEVGDAYGLEFANLDLPTGYIFGNKVPSAATPVENVSAMVFNPLSASDGSNEQVEIAKLAQGDDGGFTTKKLDSTTAPSARQSQQND